MNWEAWIALATALVAIGALYLESHRSRRAQMYELAAMYIQRYWQIDDDLLLTSKDDELHRRHRHRYLRLCEDEFAAARRKMLDEAMWEEWHAWLTSPSQRKQLVDDLEVVGGEARLEYLRACLNGAVGHDWAACPSAQR